MTFNFAFLGCSNIAAKHALSLEKIPEAKLVAVCDIDPEKARAFGEKHEVKWYTDYRDMIKEQEIDVISILTPSGLHGKNIIELAPYGRHLMVEKPLALKLDEADEAIKACDENGIKLFVVQQNRFNPPIVKLKETIEQGKFGRLVMGTVRVRWCRPQHYYDQSKWRGTWAMDGGVLTNQASHHIDMLSWLMGPVESVMCMTDTFLADIEAEDTGIAVIRFANKALGIIEATTATRPKDLEGSISILGEKGSVEVGGFFMNEIKTWEFIGMTEEDKAQLENYRQNPNVPAWNHTEYIKDVIHSLKDNVKGLVDGLDGRKSLELINALYESAETRKEIFLRFKPKKCRLGQEVVG
ncbi:Gfo/Idh/MocA family protein [Candidatus Contubernalis alkaliaceticus]|uniref:Gfo/Idh/MocA family protein n=1 Tax=Candidatus Contubernalis alkaliaceticus TaxID=338645 RepID=UPI001F4C29D7|nr:Gfo/Idh/MocA family oxidoreductase [Candidatus Contubernalis alkalaceticus]UNC93627.1 Gfo/Idh/MocA family oxidoreductase [Candidatus Contubernalis alkalaceticus]